MPLTVATPRVKPVQEYEQPFFKATPSPDVSNLLDVGTMVPKAQVQEAEEFGGAARNLLAGVLHKKAELEHGMAITAATRSIGELDAKLDDLNKEYIDRLDGTNTKPISDELSTKRKEIIEEHRNALKDNPAAYNFFERHLPSTERSSIKHFVDTAKVIDSNSAEMGVRAYTGIKVKSVNPATFIDDDKDLMSAALENTLIKPEDRPKLARLAREQLAGGMIETYLKDPKLAPGFIEVMKSENKSLDSIDPDKPGEKVTFAEAVWERTNPTKTPDYKALLKTAAKGQVTDQAYRDIFKDSGGDPQKAIQILNTPEALDKYKIDTEQQKSLEVNFSNAVRAQKFQDQEYVTSTWMKWGKTFTENSLTEADIANDVKGIKNLQQREETYKQGLTFLRKEAAEERREKREKEHLSLARTTAAKQAKKEKSDTISGQIEAKILRGEEFDRLTIYKEVPNGLDVKEANRLVTEKDKIANDPKYKEGQKIIDIAFRNGVIKPEDLSATIKTYKAQVDAAGAGADSSKIAQELIAPKKPSKVKEWMDDIYFKPVEAAKQRELKAVGAKTVNIDGKLYKDGDIILREDGTKGIVRIK